MFGFIRKHVKAIRVSVNQFGMPKETKQHISKAGDAIKQEHRLIGQIQNLAMERQQELIRMSGNSQVKEVLTVAEKGLNSIVELSEHLIAMGAGLKEGSGVLAKNDLNSFLRYWDRIMKISLKIRKCFDALLSIPGIIESDSNLKNLRGRLQDFNQKIERFGNQINSRKQYRITDNMKQTYAEITKEYQEVVSTINLFRAKFGSEAKVVKGEGLRIKNLFNKELQLHEQIMSSLYDQIVAIDDLKDTPDDVHEARKDIKIIIAHLKNLNQKLAA